MFDPQPGLLIVDDDTSTRTSDVQLLAESGYRVRPADDGFAALREIRKELPDMILSDLHMPGMSGYELFSVVRRRFPAIQVIVMSISIINGEMPLGVAADACCGKDTAVPALLQIMQSLLLQKRIPSSRQETMMPIWIQPNGLDAEQDAYVTIACPECLRTFHEALDSSLCQIRETECVHCRNAIQYALVHPIARVSTPAFPHVLDESDPHPTNPAEFCY